MCTICSTGKFDNLDIILFKLSDKFTGLGRSNWDDILLERNIKKIMSIVNVEYSTFDFLCYNNVGIELLYV